ncbi:hypothetical protein FRAHR75_620018 [Frankia sp. Hr75.2]|nr:hypothetical protein FRAHR75_620018 [Frankia sp. Hr75.2]
MTLAQLSERLGTLGRPILPTGLSKIENGERRVDVDDLVALALALDVAPNALLLPAEPDSGVEVPLTAAMSAAAGEAWRWAIGLQPLVAGRRAWELPVIDEERMRESFDDLMRFRRESQPHGAEPPAEYRELMAMLGEANQQIARLRAELKDRRS